MPAKNAIKAERRIVDLLQRRGIETRGETDADGSHVSWDRDSFPVTSLKKLIKMADEGK